MISAPQLLDLLEKKEWVPANIMAMLRKQVAAAGANVTAAAVCKRLVEKGVITQMQANALLESAPPAAPQPAPATLDEDDYGLADEEPAAPKPAEPGLKPVARTPEKGKEQAAPKKLATAGENKGETAKTEAKPAQGKSPGKLGPKPMGSLGGAGSDQPVIKPSDDDDDGYGMAGEEAPAPTAKPSAGAGKASAEGKAAADKGKPKKAAKAAAAKGPRQPMNMKVVAPVAVMAVAAIASIGLAAFLVTRPDGSDALKPAEAAYQSRDYAQAADQYAKFLEKFPRHSQAGLATVRRGLAQVRVAVAAGNMPNALSTTRQVLSELETLAAFSEAQKDLAEILPAIAAPLVEQARKNPDVASLKQATEAVDLLRRYVPKSARNYDQLSDLDVALALAQRKSEQSVEVDRAAANIEQAASAGKFADARSARLTLLSRFPAAADASRLQKAMQAIASAERGALRLTEKKQAAKQGDAASPITASTAMVHRRVKSTAPAGDGQTLYLSTRGSTFALEGNTGKVLWRRYTGTPVAGRGLAPQPALVSDQPGADPIVLDAAQNEIVRLEAATGKARWRAALGEPATLGPVVVGSRVLAPTLSSKVFVIDAESGQSPGFVQLPQGISAATAIPGRDMALLVGDEANLYVLAADGKCKQVVYLGHEGQSITATPVAAGNLILLASNDGLRWSTVRVLVLGGDDSSPVKATQQFVLRGHVTTPMSFDGNRLAVATDAGSLHVFAVNAADTAKPLQTQAEIIGRRADDSAPFALLAGDQVWKGGDELQRYALQQAEGTLTPQAASLPLVVQAPLRLVGQAVVAIAEKPGVEGSMLCAFSPTDGQTYWQCWVGGPAVGPAVEAGGQTVLLTTTGGLFSLTGGALPSSSALEAIDGVPPGDLEASMGGLFKSSGNELLAVGGPGSSHTALFTPSDSKSFRVMRLPEPLGGQPVALGGGALAPLRSGMVMLLDPKTGGKLAEPTLANNLLPAQWRTAAGSDSALLAGNDGRVRAVAVQSQPKPQLVVQASASLASVADVAVAGKHAYTIDAANNLVCSPLAKLEGGTPLALGGSPAWGPASVGNRALVFLRNGQLLAVEAGKQVWQVDFAPGTPAGTPVEAAGHYLVASQSGTVARIEAATGKIAGKTETGVAAADLLLLGKRVVLVGADGSLNEIKQP